MDDLFPSLPESLSELDDEQLANLLKEHEVAAELIDADDQDFTKGLDGDQIMAAYDQGVEQIEKIVAEQKARAEAIETYNEEKEARRQRRLEAVGKAEEEAPPEDEGDGDEEDSDKVVEAAEEITAEAAEEPVAEETAEVEVAEELEPVLAAAETPKEVEKVKDARPPMRRPPAPSLDRQLQETATSLVAASGLQEVRAGQPLNPETLAYAMSKTANRWGAPSRTERGTKERMLIARADFVFPEERRLTGNYLEDAKKIKAVIPNTVSWGDMGGGALTASGGLCAPLTPIYSMPNFASQAEPVWDSLPIFQADRGGVNVPAATYIADVLVDEAGGAITSISEANDALGGTFATKTCQPLECPAYTEVAVQIIAHCREYGNLNAMAWPEKIAHENELTMAALSRTSESFIITRIKNLSINVTQAAVGSQYGSYASLVHAIVKASAGIRFRLRMSPDARFRVLLPSWILDHLVADTAATQFDRFQAQAQLAAHLNTYRVSVSYYLDDVTGGTSQGFAAEAAGALDEFPDDVQYAIFPEGQFIGVDSGGLELGIVRDSDLNSTNDFQIFGERFRNLAMLGPDQGALWVTQDICPTGSFPAAATALTC